MPVCLPSDPSACAAPAGAPLATPLDALGDDLAAAFGGANLLFYAGAAAGSAAMAFSGADSSLDLAVRQHLVSNAYGNAASLTGYILPAVVAPGVWVTGFALRDRAAAGAGSAAVQALAVTLLTTAVLKIGVGRDYPAEDPQDAHSFRPFQGWSWPFAAWPSGHAASATSVVAALTAYYGPDEIWIPFVGYPLALAVGVGMLAGEEHWTSDLLAGAVIGQCIGWSIGRAFRARARGDAAPRLSLVPIVGPSSQGMGIGGQW